MTYKDAVTRGDYDRYTGNLGGKYDNVRIYWEDQLTRLALRPFLVKLMAAHRGNARLRILDLGAGSGQGYEAITKIDRRDLDLGLYHQRIVTAADIGLYLGLDLDAAMVAKGRELFASHPNVRFETHDLREGLGRFAQTQPPFDLYLSCYGALSHLNRDDLQRLLADICRHGRPGSVVVLDLLGRYSLEWPAYWQAGSEGEKWRNYSMSYLYAEAERRGERKAEIEWFPMRFWADDEIDDLARDVMAPNGLRLVVRKKMDRSLMVGRHIDTGEYNPNLKPMRRLVNRLHQDYMRTDLTQLRFDPQTLPRHPDPTVAAFFHELIHSWNALIDFCQLRLTQEASLVDLEEWATYPPSLQFALMTIDRVINSSGWMWYGDPRANVIEPQLGYALRSLESGLQRGLGCGHGLLVVLELVEQPETG